MSDDSDSSLLTDGRLGVVYVAGIALNVVAGAVAAMSGQPLAAITFGVVIVYLGARFWMLRG